MDKDYLQNIRYKLQKRVAYLKSCQSDMFLFVLKRFWNYINNEKIIYGILKNLKTKYPDLINDSEIYFENNKKYLTIDNEEENAALCLNVIEKISEKENAHVDYKANIGWHFIGGYESSEGHDAFNDFILDPFFEFIDESIDDNRAILSLLLKYKQRSEWFHKNKLFELWEDNKQIGEQLLAKDLYEYLFDQGLDFYIESKSEVGRVDLIESQIGDNRLLAEIKIFNKDVSYMAKGFNQVYTYTHTYNQPVGYLIIFKTCEEELQFSLKNQDNEFKYVTINNKTIFFLTIDIFKYDKSASQRGTFKSYEITEDDLMKTVEDKQAKI